MNIWTPEQIKVLRQSLQLTQKKFSVLIGVTDIYVNYLEKGVKRPSKILCLLLDRIQKEFEENEKGKEDTLHGKKSKRSL